MGTGKVTVVNTSRSATGFGRYATDLANALGDSGMAVSFQVMRRDARAEFPGLRFTGFSLPFFSTESQFANSICAYLNSRFFRFFFRKGISYAAGQLGSGGIFHYASQEVFPFRTTGEEVVTIHDLAALREDFGQESFSAKQYRKLVLRNISIYRRFRRIIAVSDFVRGELEREGFDGDIRAVHSPVSSSFRPLGDKEGARRRLGLPMDKKLILSVSTMHRRKNLGTVREAVESLGTGARLVRVGGQVGNSITFSNVDAETLNTIYNACDVLLFPSKDEGLGYPVIEAFAAGLPVVASDIEVMREIAGNAGILVEPVPGACSDGIRQALASGGELSAKGIERAKEFSFSEFAGRMKGYYSSLD